MLNINAFWSVVHEKMIFKIYQKKYILPLIGPQKESALLFERICIPIPKHVSCQVWCKLALWFLRSRLKEKVDAGPTDGRCAMA